MFHIKYNLKIISIVKKIRHGQIIQKKLFYSKNTFQRYQELLPKYIKD